VSEPDPEPPLADQPSVTMPATPENLQISNNRNSTATLLWIDAASNEDSYRVERQKLNGGDRWSGSTAWTLDANTSSFTDSSGTGSFRYRVAAVNSAGAAWTDWITVEVTRR
jgi:thermitase